MLDECPWVVLHEEHVAWFLRALLPGDFAPGRTAIAEYVVYSDGLPAHPDEAPTCEGCGAVAPPTEELIPVERATGRREFLLPFWRGDRPWPDPTNQTACWWCHCRLPAERGARVCPACAAYLSR